MSCLCKNFCALKEAAQEGGIPNNIFASNLCFYDLAHKFASAPQQNEKRHYQKNSRPKLQRTGHY